MNKNIYIGIVVSDHLLYIYKLRYIFFICSESIIIINVNIYYYTNCKTYVIYSFMDVKFPACLFNSRDLSKFEERK